MTLHDGVWFHNDRVFLSPTSSLTPLILANSHSSPVGGHFRFHKTISRISHSFFWPKLRQTVKEYLQICAVCQQCKSDCMKPAGLLQPLPIPTRIWTDISMDFIEGLPISNDHSVIMVVVDRLSKYAHFIPLKHPFTADSVAKTFVANVVRLHGIPLWATEIRSSLAPSGKPSFSYKGHSYIWVPAIIPRSMDRQGSLIASWSNTSTPAHLCFRDYQGSSCWGIPPRPRLPLTWSS